ncbi:hypothetical protein KEM56_006670 [Ascosphaera pollenicola]|nr:hypothetical protein KEM56_006670 [Ascosphaera pollenicola]
MAAEVLSATETAVSSISFDATSTSSIASATSLAATASASLLPFSSPPFPFNTPLFSGVYAYLSANLPRTLTQVLLLPFYLIYHIEVFVLSTLPRQLAYTFRLDHLLSTLRRLVIWTVDDVLGDIDFIVRLTRKAGFAIGRGAGNAAGGADVAGGAGRIADAIAEDPIDSFGDFAEVLRGSDIHSDDLLCQSIIINRITVFGRTRVPIQMDWKRRLVIRAIPILLLSRSLLSILRTMRCQFSPDYALYRYADASVPLKHIDYGKEPGVVYTIISAILSPFESEAQSCSAMGMLRESSDGIFNIPRGSFNILWDVFVRLCISQMVDAFSCAVTGRTQMHEMGMSLFEQSLMFSEAQGMIESTINLAITKGKERRQLQAKSSLADVTTGTIATLAAATVTGITNQTPSPVASNSSAAAASQVLAPITAIVAKRSIAATYLNVTPEMLFITVLTVAHNISANILCVLGKEHRYRLAHTTFWAICLFAYNLSGFYDIRSFIRYPTVAIVGFGPHLSLMIGIVGCLLIYGIALTLTAFSLPGELPANITIRERFSLARDNMQSDGTIRSLRVNRSEEFFSALVRVGYEVLSAASKMVFLNEGKPISARALTWLEEERLAELANERQEQAERQRQRISDVRRSSPEEETEDMALDLAECDGLFDFDVVGHERPWRSGYAVEKRVDAKKEEAQKNLARQRQTEFVGVGLWRNIDRVWQTLSFWKAIVKLILGWICFGIVKGMDKIRWRWKPNWLIWMAGIPKEEAIKACERENERERGAGTPVQESGPSQDGQEFYIFDTEGKPVLPKDKDFDVETEMRKKAFKEERAWTEESEQRFERKLYEWWKNGGIWGETDASGDYTLESGAEDWDATSVISMSSNRSATPSISGDDDGWEFEDENEDGRRTPTQTNPWGDDVSSTNSVFRRRNFETATPNPDSDSDSLFDVDHLSRLLEGQDEESRNEAHILASHLRASKEGRIMTRAGYRKELELQKARVLTSSRLKRARLQPSSSSTPLETQSSTPLPASASQSSMPWMYHQQEGQNQKPSLAEESEILERLILSRRLDKPSNPLSQGMTSTFGEQGPQCVDYAVLDEDIERIYLCAHENQKTESLDAPPSTHWTFILQTNKHNSVEMGITPEAGADLRDGMISLNPQRKFPPEDSVQIITIVSKPSTREVFYTLRRKGIDRFKFDENMGGERYWCNKVIEELESSDLIPTASKEKCQEALEKYYPEPKGSKAIPRPLDHGDFYQICTDTL